MIARLPIAISVVALALATLLLSTGAHAYTQADCVDPTATLVLAGQPAVDSFPCTSVAGDLDINTLNNPITSLAPLSGLTRVDGRLSLNFTSARSPSTLDGLENLTHVGALSIKALTYGQTGPEQLTDISALAGLSSIGPRNCQPFLPKPNTECDTDLAISSDQLTQLPVWTIKDDPNLEVLSLTGALPLANPTDLDRLPIPTKTLRMDEVTLDTSQAEQLATLARLASQARTVTLSQLTNLVVLPGMSNVRNLRMTDVALPDLSAITAANFPSLDRLSLNGLQQISPTELAPIKDIDFVALVRMSGLSGANPLAGLTGGSFGNLILTGLANVTTLRDLLSVTALNALELTDMDGLTDLDGLQNLTSITEILSINKNDNLQNVDALASLTSVGRRLKFKRTRRYWT
jgi:hypothetical protein